MDYNSFYGYGSADSKYDIRRHINVIFYELMIYKHYYDKNLFIQCVKYAKSLPEQQAAEYICNDVLSFDEHNFLNLLRERYSLSESDFTRIVSGHALDAPVVKTPAGYNRENNIRLLVQMVFARYYMRPQDYNTFVKINNMIVTFAAGMRGITISQKFMDDLLSLTVEAMNSYGNNFALKNIEDYVIARI